MRFLAAASLLFGGCAGAPPPEPPPSKLTLQEEGIRELKAVADYLLTARSLNAFLSYGNPEQGLTPARFVLGPGERMRVSMSSAKQADVLLLVSNGQDAYYRIRDKVYRAAAPKGLKDDLCRTVGLLGVLTGTTLAAQRLDAPSRPPTFEKLLTEIRIKTLESGSIAYEMRLVNITYRLSYDPKTHRPLRRTLKYNHTGATPGGPSELWETILYDQPIDEIEFEIPP